MSCREAARSAGRCGRLQLHPALEARAGARSGSGGPTGRGRRRLSPVQLLIPIRQQANKVLRLKHGPWVQGLALQSTYPLSSGRSVDDTGGKKMRNRAITLREEITAPDSGASIRNVGLSDDSTRLSVVALKTARSICRLATLFHCDLWLAWSNSPERVNRQEHMPVPVCYWTDQAELLRSSREGGGCGHQYQQAPSPSRARIGPPIRSWGIHTL